jgi:hypothetical protein
LISDVNGTIICWMDRRNGTSDANVYAEKLSTVGAIQWTPNGLPLCTAAGNQASPQLVSDGNGGAIVTWDEVTSAAIPNPNIYAQRVDASGVAQWAADGVGVCLAANRQGFPKLTADGAGGAIITWDDARSGSSNRDIYAQRLDSGGAALWVSGGVAVSTATFLQSAPIILDAGFNGVIVAWTDYRNDLGGTRNDIYAQRLRVTGELVSVPSEASLSFALDPVRPNPARGGRLPVRFTLASNASASIELLDVAGRRIAAREVDSFGAGSHTLDLGHGQHLAPGVYLVRLRQGANIRAMRVAVLD